MNDFDGRILPGATFIAGDDSAFSQIFTLKRIHEGNAKELFNVQDNFQKIRFSRNPVFEDAPNNVTIEFARTLQNFIGSYYSLYQVTTKWMKKCEPKFKSEYDKKFNELNLFNESRFLLDLRAYMQHGQVPIFYANWRFGDTPSQKISFFSKDLLKWKNWKKESKVILKKFESGDGLCVFLRSFDERYSKFYTWLLFYLNPNLFVKDPPKPVINIVEIIKNFMSYLGSIYAVPISGIMALLLFWIIVYFQNPLWIGNESFVMGIETGIISGFIVYVMTIVHDRQKIKRDDLNGRKGKQRN